YCVCIFFFFFFFSSRRRHTRCLSDWSSDVCSSDLLSLARAEVEMEREIGRTRVLLVDDNLDAANGLAMLLGLLGHEVQIVNDGRSEERRVGKECRSRWGAEQ